MATKHTPKPLESIELASLHDVTGGRIAHSSQPDPQVVNGLKSLAETIQALTGAKSQAEQQQKQQMMGVMQQLMQQRGGR